MNNSFRCPFTIKMKHLLTNRSIFEEIEATGPGSKRIRRIDQNAIAVRFGLAIGVDHSILELAELYRLTLLSPVLAFWN